MGGDGELTDLWAFLVLTVGLLQMNERSFFSLVSVLQRTDIQSLLDGSEIRTKHVRKLKYNIKLTAKWWKTSAQMW